MSGSSSPVASSTRSRKPSADKKSPSGETSFAFLNFSHPAEAKDQKARRTVRSHVTRQQHQKEQLAAAAIRRPNSLPQPLETPIVPESRAYSDSHFLVAPGPTSLADQWSPASSSSSPGASATPSPSSSHVPVDPRHLYPRQWIPYVNLILENYVTSISHNVLKVHDHATTEALRTLWIPFVFTDAALLHATLLVGTSFLGSPPRSRPHEINLLQLRGMAMSAINESFQNPTRSVSDQMIAAVLSMAQYEAGWGEAPTFTIHMRAVEHMVKVRGGLQGISSSLYGLLERMIIAIDCHTSRLTGTRATFDAAQPSPSTAHSAYSPQNDSATPSYGTSKQCNLI